MSLKELKDEINEARTLRQEVAQLKTRCERLEGLVREAYVYMESVTPLNSQEKLALDNWLAKAME